MKKTFPRFSFCAVLFLAIPFASCTYNYHYYNTDKSKPSSSKKLKTACAAECTSGCVSGCNSESSSESASECVVDCYSNKEMVSKTQVQIKSTPQSKSLQQPSSLKVVQKVIQKGMTKDQVTFVLGLPNVMTHDKLGKEAWIYDRVKQEVLVEESQCHDRLVFVTDCQPQQKKSKKQFFKSLTIVVKFDCASCVDTISYHKAEF